VPSWSTEPITIAVPPCPALIPVKGTGGAWRVCGRPAAPDEDANMLRYLLALGLALAGAPSLAQSHADACQNLLPRSLSDALARAYPGYRTPLETDNAPDDIEYNRDHGGSGCLGVGIGELTGEGKQDYVIGLTARKGRGGRVVIAMPRKGGWHFQDLRSGSEATRFLQYVEVVEAGRFDRPGSVTTPLQPGERAGLVCPHPAARVGTVEASATVYCYQEGRWLSVIVAD